MYVLLHMNVLKLTMAMDTYSCVVEMIITSVISSHDGTIHGDMAVSSP